MITTPKNVICGIALTAVTMLIEYEHCMDGPGRGFPFAVYTPACGSWFFILKLDDSKIPQVIDFGALIVNILFWSLLAGFVRFQIYRYMLKNTYST
jgi:hypothetical protein